MLLPTSELTAELVSPERSDELSVSPDTSDDVCSAILPELAGGDMPSTFPQPHTETVSAAVKTANKEFCFFIIFSSN